MDEPHLSTPDAAPAQPAQKVRWMLPLIGLVLLLPVLLLHLSPVSTGVARWAAGTFNPYAPEATLTIGRVSGSPFTGLTLTGIRLATDSDSWITLDTLILRYALTDLLRSELHFSHVRIAGLSIQAYEDSNGVLNLLKPFPADTTVQVSEPFAWTVRVDTLALERVSGQISFYSSEKDSIYRVNPLTMQVAGLLLRPDLLPEVQHLALSGRYVLPGQADAGEMHVEAALSGGRLQIDSLSVLSPLSRVHAAGSVTLPGYGASGDPVHLDVTATPFAFAELAPWVAGLDASRTVTLDARLRGTLQDVEATLGAMLSDGSSASARVRYSAAPFLLHADIHLNRIDPAFFTPSRSDLNGIISAHFTAALEGDSLSEASGPADFSVREFRLGALRVNPTVLAMVWTQGEATLRFRSSLPGLAVAASGRIAPFRAVPEYSLNLQPSGVRLEELMPDLGFTSNLEGALRLTGQGFDPATMRVAVDLASLTGEFNALPVSLSLSGIMVGARWNGTVEASVEEASVMAQASVTWQDEFSATLSRLRVQGLNLATLIPGQEETDLNLSMSGQVRGSVPARMSLSAQAIVLPSRYGAYAIDGVELDATLRNGSVRVLARGQLAGGSLDALATARPFLATPRFTLEYLNFNQLNARLLGGESLPETRLTGRIEGLAEGLDPAEMLAQVVLELQDGVINDQVIQAGTLRASLQQSEVKGQLSISLPEGNSMVRFSTRPFDSLPSFAVSEARIRGLNVGALADVPDFDTDLNLNLTLEGVGFTLATLVAEAQVDLRTSRINQGTLNDGSLAFSWRDEGAELEGRFQSGTGRITLVGNATQVRDLHALTYAMEVGVQEVNWAPFLANPPSIGTLDARFSLRGQGLYPATLNSQAALHVEEASWEDVRVSPSRILAVLQDGVLRVDDLEISSNVLALHGGGTLALFDSLRTVSRFALEGMVLDVNPLRKLFPETNLTLESGQFSVNAGGEPGTLRAEVRMQTQAVQFTALRAAGLDLVGVAEFGPNLSLLAAEVTSRVDFLSHPQLNVRTANATAQYWNEQVTVDVNLLVDDRRSMEARGTLVPEVAYTVFTLEHLRLQLDQDRWRLQQPAEIILGDSIVVRQLVLVAPQQQMIADGILNPRGEQFFGVTMEDVRIGSIMELLGYRGFDGILNGMIDLTGPAQSPELQGDVRLSVVSFGKATGDVQIGLEYSNLQLRPDITFTHEDGSMLQIAGFIPLDLRLSVQALELLPEEETGGSRRTQARAQRERFALTADEESVDQNPLRLTVQAEAFDISWIKPFLDPALIARLDGKLTAAIEVGGTLATPTLAGTAQLRRGRIDIPLLGRYYDAMDADLGFAQEAITLRSFTARSGGLVTGQGTIALDQLTPGAIDIGLRFTNFLAIDNDEFRFRVDGPLQIGGDLDGLDVTGNLRVRSGDIRLTSRATFEDVPLTADEVLTLESRFGIRVAQRDTVVSELYNAMRLQVNVQLERDTWIRSSSTPEMDIQFMGSLDVTKAPNQDLALFGDIEVLPERSRVVQFGRRFDITQGQILFNGPLEEMIIRLNANFTPRNRAREDIATITLGIDGRPLVQNDLSLELSSDPQLELADIISYIATGRPASQSLQFGGSETSLTDQAAGLALGQLAGFVQGAAQRQLGLDVIEIEQNGFNSTRLTAGKYISNRFFAAVSQPITFNSSAQNSSSEGSTVITVEYEFRNWLFGRFVREGSVLRGTLNWEFAY